MEDNENGAAKICSECGMELEEGAIFCGECGAPQKVAPVVPPPIVKDPAAGTAPEPMQKPASEDIPPVLMSSEPQPKREPEPVPEVGTGSPAPETRSESPAQDKKFCPRCGMQLAMDMSFCPKCGAAQAASSEAPNKRESQAGPTISLPPIDFGAIMAGVSRGGLNHILLLAAVVTALSIFMPMITISLIGSVRFMDIAPIFSGLVFLLGVGSSFASMLGRYDVPVVCGHGLFATFLFGVYKYQSTISQLTKSFWGALAKNAISPEWGSYMFLLAIFMLIVIGLIASVQKDGQSPDKDSLISKWKSIMFGYVKLNKLSLQGAVWSLALAALLILTLIQSEGMRQLGA